MRIAQTCGPAISRSRRAGIGSITARPRSASRSPSRSPSPGVVGMSHDQFVFRVLTRGTDGEIQTREYLRIDSLEKTHTQVGIDDCSTDLALRGLPLFHGLIGPIPDGKGFVRYETPEVFET